MIHLGRARRRAELRVRARVAGDRGRVARVKALADQHGVTMKAAGLQFALANPAVVAVIPGASRPERMAEDRAALTAPVPAAFWTALREAGLVHRDAPLPA